jgi:hypothetical protein
VFPIAATLPNPCPPEEAVAFEGRLHLLIRGEPDNFLVHTNTLDVHGLGVISGDRYVVSENEKSQTIVTSSDGSATQFFNLRFHMIREGSEDNFFFHAIITFTLDPNGEILDADVTKEEIQCRG